MEVISKGVSYKFLIHIKNTSDKLLILGPGALPKHEREKFFHKPKFNRYTWPFKLSTIVYDDPTRHIDGVDILGGWGIGTPDNWYLKELSEIFKIIANKLFVYENLEDSFKNLIFFGSSMAGFMSMELAILVKNSTAIAEIPQLDLTKWVYWPTLKNQIFRDVSCDEIKKEHLHKLNVIDFMIKEKYIPNAYLILDCSHELDFSIQYFDFLSKLNQLPFKDNANVNKIRIRVDGKNIGHSPLNYVDTYKLVEDVSLLLDNSLLNQDKLINNYFVYERSPLKKRSELLKYMTARIDIKNSGIRNSINLLNYTKYTTIKYPQWFDNDEGRGIVFENSGGQFNLRFKCIHDGVLKIALRGVFKKFNSKTIPIYINFTNFSINGVNLIHKSTIVCHDSPVKFEHNVHDGEIINIHAEWLPF